MTSLLFKLIIFTLISSYAQASPKNPTLFTKGEICGAIFLKLIQDKQFDVSGRDEETYNTVLSFKNFRVNNLHNYHTHRMGFENINTYSVEAKKYQRDIVSDRIRGLETVYEWNYTPVKGEEDYIAFGTQIRGKVNIEEFFSRVKREAFNLRNVRTDYISQISQFNIHNEFPLAIGAAGFVTLSKNQACLSSIS